MATAPEDEMDDRARMEASENTGLPPQGGGGTGLQRIDLARVSQALGSPQRAGGYARLELMLNAVLPRLVSDPRENRR